MTYFLVFCCCLIIINIGHTIECQTVYGEVSTSQNRISNINCQRYVGYTLISCGFDSTTTRYFAGTYIINNTCYAQSTFGGTTIIAIGLCCDLTQISVSNDNCIDKRSPPSNDNVNEYISISCDSPYTMVGCQFYNPSAGNGIMGSDNNGGCVTNTDQSCQDSINIQDNIEYCVAVDGTQNTGGVTANVRCCDLNQSINTCISVWSQESYPLARISCPNDYYMLNCIGYHSQGFIYLKGWWIENNECVVKSENAPPGMYAIGTCCQINSLNPTNTPSIIPTIYPVKIPTITPTYSPSITPIESPIMNPTQNPSGPPSINPTLPNTPTQSPIINPTTSPSSSPSITPSLFPTTIPTNYPTNMTISPSMNPTKNETSNEDNANPIPSQTESNTIWWIIAIAIILVLTILLIIFVCLYIKAHRKNIRNASTVTKKKSDPYRPNTFDLNMAEDITENISDFRNDKIYTYALPTPGNITPGNDNKNIGLTPGIELNEGYRRISAVSTVLPDIDSPGAIDTPGQSLHESNVKIATNAEGLYTSI